MVEDFRQIRGPNSEQAQLADAATKVIGVVRDHRDEFNSEQPEIKLTPTDKTLIPTGELKSVEGTPFDFRTPTAIGARIEAKDQQIEFGPGYDHNWVLDREEGGGLQLAARVHDPATGRVMEIKTTEPGLQFYSGNFLDGTITGKGGHVYKRHAGMCLETQHYPDSPNKPKFPSTILKPGEDYRSHTVYTFSVQKP